MGGLFGILLAGSKGWQLRRGEEPPPWPDSYAAGVKVCQVDDARITESSGLVASRREPDVFWTHNDSGDGPYVYAFDRRGRLLAVATVAGAEARDWEDMAIGPGPEPGKPYLYLGDIGDNLRRRETVTVYRVLEPSIDPQQTDVALTLSSTEALVLRYPDHPHDAETLLVHPCSGALYIVVKEDAPTDVYRAWPPFRSGEAQTLEKVGALSVVAATGGDIAPDGRRVALRNYLEAFEYLWPQGQPFDAIWTVEARTIVLPPMRQGEALAYRSDGWALLTTSEGRPMPVFEMLGRSNGKAD